MTARATAAGAPNPYVVPPAIDDGDPTTPVIEATLVADHTEVDLGNGLMAHAETFNGTVPGPTFRLNRGDTLYVRLKNNLPHPTGIHWHGVEMANKKDGTPFTQNHVPPGGTYLYKLHFPRAGLFWYHPHHHASTNQVFRGLYGAIIVSDPAIESGLVGSALPAAADTLPLVLSDATVCKAPGSNDAATYSATLPWAGGATLPAQPGPTPAALCELPTAIDDEGVAPAASYLAGDIPSIQQLTGARTNEGQTVLTNGVNVGGRSGSPSAPGALAGTAFTYPVLAGQGLRLHIFNTAAIRYFRLLLTTSTGAQVPLLRIGGEGGLLDTPVQEGGVIAGFDTKYTAGEILLAAGSRADVVAAIPSTATGVLTLWTQDYRRTGGGAGWSNIPTVPVAHFQIMGTAASPYTIAATTTLRSGANVVEALAAATATLLDPLTFVPAKDGRALQNIQLTVSGAMTGIDGVVGTHDATGPYTGVPHMLSSRYATEGDTLELTVENTSSAHHPFHLHGFSFQPLSLTHPSQPAYTWPYREFRDNLDIPAGYTLTFRVRLDPRPLVDGTLAGGALGRWMFHCHIFFHAHLGMISELVVCGSDGREKPFVDVDGSWAYTPAGGIATRTGTYAHPDGSTITLSASTGAIVDNGDGTWSWSLNSTGLPDQITYVYITAQDAAGRRDQALFRLKIGAPDDGADNGDPHVHTVNGRYYDFQGVGEFVLLRDRDGLEVQARHSPVAAANPIVDPNTGIRACVSVNTAVAARIGAHRIAYEPWGDGQRLQLFVDGKPAKVPRDGLDLGLHRLTTYEVDGGGVAVRVDYAHGPVLAITPWFWASYGIWILNVSVTRTHADEGIMGPIPRGTWLPALPNGATVGSLPQSLHERFAILYRTFADAWRVTDATSLFVYDRGTSTKTFADRDWPAEKLPCTIKPELVPPGGAPTLAGMKVEQAETVCRLVTMADLRRECVFDVATTGDEVFAFGYRLAQELRLRGTAVQVTANRTCCKHGHTVVVTAVVSALHREARRPCGGNVMFLVDDRTAEASELDDRGHATFLPRGLAPGDHRIRAVYDGGKDNHQPSCSPNLIITIGCDDDPKEDPMQEHDHGHGAGGHGHGDDQEGDDHGKLEIDVKTARRILAFVNRAARPEDLMRLPEVAEHLHVEYRKRGFPERHPPVGTHEAHREIADRKLAEEILRIRDENPVYGFMRIRDLLRIDHILDLIRWWWRLFSRASRGEWTGPFDNPSPGFDRPVHAALLRTGKVLLWGLPTGKDSWLWTPDGPDVGTVAPTANKPGDSLFCAGHAFLSDGRLLVVGGGGDGTGPRHNHGWIFDPTPGVEQWTRTAGNGTPGNGDMYYHRWYPTLVTLGDEPGRVLVVSGDDTGGSDVQQMEIYFETTDRFERVWGPGGVGDTSANHSFPQIYPALNLLPGGEIFYTPTGWHSGGCSGAADFPAAKPSGYYELISTSPPATATWTNVGTQDAAAEAAISRVKGMAVLLLQPAYPFVQLLVVGGGKDPESATTFQMINLSTLTPKWGPPVTLPDGLARVNVNVVALPDGTVFVSGGRPFEGTPQTGGACWIYDPSAMTWRECDAVAKRRAYHSVALLLPDGRVLTAGNECPAELTYEVFSPPYLFTSTGALAPRPQITSLPSQVHHGHEFTIQTPAPSSITKVVLVRPMAVTHQTDSEQRVIQLQFHVSGASELTATAPNGWHPHALAPRGWYMVFLIDTNGVPSVGQFMHLH